MILEGQFLDRKSLRAVTGKSANWDELAKDCVAFANASGGRLLIGFENGHNLPSSDQRIPADLPDILRKKVLERTVNLNALPEVVTASNGGQFLDLHIPRSLSTASTTDGRYFIRVADQSKPITGDEIQRLVSERSALPWETLINLKIPRKEADEAKQDKLLQALRASDRVKSSVKEKSDDELIDHYQLAQGNSLTNLGILCIGRQHQRAHLPTAPIIQFLKWDEHGHKVNKLVWDDYSLSPMELSDAVWTEVPDFRETYELPDGMYRKSVPAFDEVVVRELLVNALVHRPYTQRGDIFLNLHPDRLEVVNPGTLPLGVTPTSVLHTTVRRNEHLARLFHDLKLMEREGSGFDKMFEVLLSQGRPVPVLIEEHDRVQVTVKRRFPNPDIIDFMAQANKDYNLTQRERITLGLLAQRGELSARELATALELQKISELDPWLKRPVELQLVHSLGRAKSKIYFIAPNLLPGFNGKTSPKKSRLKS